MRKIVNKELTESIYFMIIKKALLGLFILGSFSAFAIKIDDLKSFIQHESFENDLKKRICNAKPDMFAHGPFVRGKTKVCETHWEHLLISRICIPASRTLLSILRDKFPFLVFSHVITADKWPSGFYHVFIIVENFYDDGSNLIIDPTYGQFIATKENYDTYRDEQPQVFVGKYEELEKLHNQYKYNNPENYLLYEPMW